MEAVANRHHDGDSFRIRDPLLVQSVAPYLIAAMADDIRVKARCHGVCGEQWTELERHALLKQFRFAAGWLVGGASYDSL